MTDMTAARTVVVASANELDTCGLGCQEVAAIRRRCAFVGGSWKRT